MDNLYSAVVPQLKRSLTNVERWLDKAEAFAAQKKFDANSLLTARLAPDQFPLTRQIQSVCDQAKFMAARLAGKTPPSHPDTEQTIAELRARLAAVKSYLDTFQPADFAGAEERTVTLPFQGGTMRGFDYLIERQYPNYYFHVCMVYAILRHNGVDVGKGDFIGDITVTPAVKT